MKSTLADNKQVWNIKALHSSAGTEVDAVPNNTFAVVDMATGKTINPATTPLASLTGEYQVVQKINGKTLFSLGFLNSKNVVKKDYAAYQAGQPEIWSTILKNCDCTKSAQIAINIDESSLIMRDGLTWAHRDFMVEVAPNEAKCVCKCSTPNPVYANNVFTKIFVEKINAKGNPFYEAGYVFDVADISNTGTGTPPSPTNEEKGDLYKRTGGANTFLYIFNGTAWVQVSNASYTPTKTQLQTYIDIIEELSIDCESKGTNLILQIKGKNQTAGTYHDMEANYVYPRGVKLLPVLSLNEGKVTIPFTKTQSLIFEEGAGYDMRAEEWDNFSYYHQVNPLFLSDGVPSNNLPYQFENGTNYNIITIEYVNPKTETNDGDKMLFGMVLGAATGVDINNLKTFFGVS